MTTPESREKLRRLPEQLATFYELLGRRIFGQQEVLSQLLSAFFAGGHVLIEGVPGLAKTLMIKTMAQLFDLKFARVQFTPDLMPSDITGTSILMSGGENREFRFRPGPIFTHLLLTDEINRTPPKTQAALLEAMEEMQVSIAGKPHPLERPFFVLATQNPMEHEGTYPLPITQLDRFMFKVLVDYPDLATEFTIVSTTTAIEDLSAPPVLTREEVLDLIQLARGIHVPDRIVVRATRLVRATRPQRDVSDREEAPAPTKEWLLWGAGPRAVQAILAGARSVAAMHGRSEVAEDDYEAVIRPALRHRILLNYHAEAEHISADEVIHRIRVAIDDLPADQPAQSQTSQRPRNTATSKVGRFLERLCDPAPAIVRRRGDT